MFIKSTTLLLAFAVIGGTTAQAQAEYNYGDALLLQRGLRNSLNEFNAKDASCYKLTIKDGRMSCLDKAGNIYVKNVKKIMKEWKKL